MAEEDSNQLAVKRQGELEKPADGFESKLEEVQEQLRANPDLYYAGEIFKHPPAGPGVGYWSETVDIIVAPVKPIFDIKRLNEFMHGLIKGLKPTSRDGATEWGEGGIHLGRLYFDESIGKQVRKIKTHITAIDHEALQRVGITPGESESAEEEDIQRRTWVRVYPDPTSARTIYEYKNGVNEGNIEYNDTFSYLEHWIDGDQIKAIKRQQNPFQKVAGLLRGK